MSSARPPVTTGDSEPVNPSKRRNASPAVVESHPIGSMVGDGYEVHTRPVSSRPHRTRRSALSTASLSASSRLVSGETPSSVVVEARSIVGTECTRAVTVDTPMVSTPSVMVSECGEAAASKLPRVHGSVPTTCRYPETRDAAVVPVGMP